MLKDPTKTKSREAFESFKKELKATLNDSLTDDEIVEMLGQHVVTQPILDALFTIQTSEGTSYEILEAESYRYCDDIHDGFP